MSMRPRWIFPYFFIFSFAFSKIILCLCKNSISWFQINTSSRIQAVTLLCMRRLKALLKVL